MLRSAIQPTRLRSAIQPTLLRSAIQPTLQRRLLCTPVTTPPLLRPTSLLLYTYCENVLEKRQPHRMAHLEHATAASDRGELLLGGALADPVDGGVILFVDSPSAHAFAESDPYVKEGIVTDYTVREWSCVVGAWAQQLTPLAPADSPFVASYAWQYVPEGVQVPAGLEMTMPLDGSRSKARIPPSWQLQVWLPAAKRYHRQQVGRFTFVEEVREAVARSAGTEVPQVTLRLGDEEMADDATLEELRLFGRDGELVVEIAEVEAAAGK